MFSTSLSSTARTARRASAGIARVAMLAAVAIFASGCSLLSENLDKAAKSAGKVVTYYCENITIPEIREEVRAAVNKHAAPHAVAIKCADEEAGPLLKSNDPASVAPDAPPASETAPPSG